MYPSELMPIEEDDRGSYILNSKDLCIIPKPDDLMRIGVDSLKVEGRGKGMYNIAIIANTYRMVIDNYYKDPKNWSADDYMEELLTVPNRGYTYAFHEGRLSNHPQGHENTSTVGSYKFGALFYQLKTMPLFY